MKIVTIYPNDWIVICPKCKSENFFRSKEAALEGDINCSYCDETFACQEKAE